MMHNDLQNKVEDLKSLMDTQLAEAKKGLDKLPEGELKHKLNLLLKESSKGKVDTKTALLKLKNILKDAS